MRFCSKERPYTCLCPYGDICHNDIKDNEFCHVEHNKWLLEKIKEKTPTEITLKDIESVMEQYERKEEVKDIKWIGFI